LKSPSGKSKIQEIDDYFAVEASVERHLLRRRMVVAAFLNLFFVVGIIFYGFPVFYPLSLAKTLADRKSIT
jgi:hypothetical protein